MTQSIPEIAGSLLLTLMISQETAPQPPEVEPLTLTGTILLLGGQRTLGVAVSSVIVGLVQKLALPMCIVSCLVTPEHSGFSPSVCGALAMVLHHTRIGGPDETFHVSGLISQLCLRFKSESSVAPRRRHFK